MTIRYDVVIVGGGHGGAQTALALRQRGFQGTIAIFTDEPDLPYERPPLSKDYLAARKPFDRMLIRPPEFWVERSVTIWTNERVVSLDATARCVSTVAGRVVTYGSLVWAAGGAARRLKCTGYDLPGVHTIRNRKDVDRLVAELPAGRQIVIIGGGYIGLETASILAGAGKSITLIEGQDRLLSRVAGSLISGFLEAEHRSRGVDIRLLATVEGIEGSNGRVCSVQLSDGMRLPADIVIVGVGIEPSVDPLRAAGCLCGNGVVVDDAGRTSLPHVYAIGDCALRNNRFANGLPVRLESVQNAVAMASEVAAALCGEDAPPSTVPWFWSHQYDHRLQTIGLCIDHDEEILHGDLAENRFSVAYLRGGHVIAVDCMNDPKTFIEARSLFIDAGMLARRFRQRTGRAGD